MGKLLRLVINLCITAGLLLLFDHFGWITIGMQNIVADPGWNTFLTAVIIGLFFTIGIWLFNMAYALFCVVTGGLGCFLAPLYLVGIGYAGLWLVNLIMPGWLEINALWWQIAVMGLVIAIFHIDGSVTKTRSTSTSDD